MASFEAGDLYVAISFCRPVFGSRSASIASPDFQPWSAGFGSVTHGRWPPARSSGQRGVTHTAALRRASSAVYTYPWAASPVWQSPVTPPGVFADTGFLIRYYSDESYPSAADPYVPENSSADPAPAQQQASGDRSDDELRAAYLQGAHDAMTRQNDSRYGEHYTDSRERRRQPQDGKKAR